MLLACPLLFCGSGSLIVATVVSSQKPDTTTPITTTATLPITATPAITLATATVIITPTAYPAPPTAVPPTAVPPTAVPPTAVPPTAVPYPSPAPVAPTRAPYPYPSPAAPTRAPYPYPSPAISNPTSTPYPEPELSPPQPVGSPPASEPGEATSGGLGIDRTAWEEKQGSSQGAEGFLELYQEGSFAVQYEEEVIYHLERRWRSREVVPIEDARNLVKRFIPSDSTLLQTINSDNGRIIDRYHSDWLATRYPGSNARALWGNGDPGDFTVTYKQIEDRTEWFIVSTGMDMETDP